MKNTGRHLRNISANVSSFTGNYSQSAPSLKFKLLHCKSKKDPPTFFETQCAIVFYYNQTTVQDVIQVSPDPKRDTLGTDAGKCLSCNQTESIKACTNRNYTEQD